MAHIYIYDLNNQMVDDNLINQLPKTIRERISKYKVQDDYNASLIAWNILNNKLLSDYNIDLKEIKLNKYNKPYIDDIYFNISHSNNLIVVMISHKECGIDIELIGNKLDHQLLANKILSCKELDEYKLSNNKQDYIIRKWTQKEAVFKQRGTGIILSELAYIDITNVSTLKIQDKIYNEYYLSYTNDEDTLIKYENKE